MKTACFATLLIFSLASLVSGVPPEHAAVPSGNPVAQDGTKRQGKLNWNVPRLTGQLRSFQAKMMVDTPSWKIDLDALQDYSQGVAWRGSGKGVRGEDILVTLIEVESETGETVLSGAIQTDKKHYQLSGVIGGDITVYEQDAGDYLQEEEGIPVPDEKKTRGLLRDAPSHRHLQTSGATINENGQYVIDVMMLITHRAICSTDTGTVTCDSTNPTIRAGAMARMLEAVDFANQAYDNSNVNLHMELARLEYLGVNDVDETVLSNSQLLSNINSSTDPVYANARNTRNNVVGADFLALIVEGSGCGVAYLTTNSNFAYSVTDVSCIGQFTFTHEIGHNQRCSHDRDNSSTLYDYSHGRCHPTPSSGNPFRTVLSYSCCSSCSRRPFFSGEGVFFGDEQTGTATEDNARWLNENVELYSSYRTRIVQGTPAPVASSASPTTSAPVTPTTSAPVTPTTSAPVTPTTSAPVTPTTSAPVTPTTSAPVTPTTSAPVTPTTSAPVTPTTSAPVTPTTSAPVTPTTSAPVTPTFAPTPASTEPPVPLSTVTKYVCNKNFRSTAQICAEGTTDVCNSSNCRNGGKQCWVAECNQGSCSSNGLLCSIGSDCCSGNCSSGTCQDPPPSACAIVGESCEFTPCCPGSTCPGGKPSGRVCQ